MNQHAADFQYIEVPVSFPHGVDSPPDALIDVQVGAAKISLAIDTGHSAAPILLSPAILSHLDAHFTGRIQEYYDAYGNKYTSREFVLHNIRIGSLSLDEVKGSEFLFPYDTKGVIGLPFLRQFNVLFNFPNQTFGLYRKDFIPEQISLPGWHKVKLVSPCPGIVIPLKLKEYSETFFFLLDSPSTYIDANEHSYDFIRVKSSLGQLLLQNEAITSYPLDEGIRGKFCSSQLQTVCGMQLPPMEFALIDTESPLWDGMIGFHFLQLFSVFIDMDKEEIYLKPC